MGFKEWLEYEGNPKDDVIIAIICVFVFLIALSILMFVDLVVDDEIEEYRNANKFTNCSKIVYSEFENIKLENRIENVVFGNKIEYPYIIIEESFVRNIAEKYGDPIVCAKYSEECQYGYLSGADFYEEEIYEYNGACTLGKSEYQVDKIIRQCDYNIYCCAEEYCWSYKEEDAYRGNFEDRTRHECDIVTIKCDNKEMFDFEVGDPIKVEVEE